MNAPEGVARYYDRNTARFLRFGGGSAALAIHRELWGPGVQSSADAKRWVNRLIGDEIEAGVSGREATGRGEQGARSSPGAPTLLDLGCGVGGTLIDLASRFPEATLHGVTVSPRQVELAHRFARERGLQARIHLHEGDFERIRISTGSGPLAADAVLAVEAFAHAGDPAAFFETAARHLASPHGLVILVDDFLARAEEDLSSADRALAQAFRAGWRLGSLTTPAACVAAAESVGLTLVHDRDLTPLIRPGRPRDRVIAALAPAFRRLGWIDVPFFGNMIGGDALQRGIRRGTFTYRMLVFAPRAASD